MTKEEVLRQAYKEAKADKGIAGIDQITFDGIEQYGAEKFIVEISKELIDGTYRPQRNKKVKIPTIKDRVIQGAIKLIIEPLFEADFSKHLFGYRPKKIQHQAVVKVAQGIKRGFTKVIDVDLSAYFDHVDHNLLMRMIKKRIKDDMVILVNGHPALDWLVKKALKRLKEGLALLKVGLNREKTKIVDMNHDETFDFLGFTYRKASVHTPREMVLMTPKKKKVQNLVAKVRAYMKEQNSSKVVDMIKGLNEILRGWVNYYRVGHSSRIFSKIRNWVERKVRRFVRKSKGRKDFGCKEWNKDVIYKKWKLFDDYAIRYYISKVNPTQ